MGTHAVSVSLYPNLAYKPDVDFEPIGVVIEVPVVIVAIGADIPPKAARGQQPLAVLVKSEIARWTPIMTAANVKGE
jgi:hypothetical protein